MKSNITYACEQVFINFESLSWGELFTIHGVPYRKISDTYALNLNAMHPIDMHPVEVTKLQRAMDWQLPTFTHGGQCKFELLPVGTTFIRVKRNPTARGHVFMKVSEDEIMDMTIMKCNHNLHFDTVEVVECEPMEITIK